MKIQHESIVIIFGEEIPELMTVLAVAMNSYSTHPQSRAWAKEQYEILSTYVENRDNK